VYAIRQHTFGGPEVLVGEVLPDLEPGTGQVRIAVAASGVHLIDTMLRRGGPGPMPPPQLPTIPGREVAGVVDRIAEGVEPDWLGRRVVAHLGQVPGGYAEQAVTTTDALIPIPDGLDDAEAVALVGTGRTALGILAEAAITADDVVLIPAAAGGIGWLLVQAARNAGATVIALASTTKLDHLRTLQPDVLLDYAATDWADHIAPAPTVILDGVGGEVGRAALESIAPGGRIVMFGMSSGTPTRLDTQDLITRSISASWALGPRMASRPGGIGTLSRGAVERGGRGEWTPLVTRYPLAEAAQAHRDLEGRRTVGKVVLITGRADQVND
jgi:NADPH:quinone reductase